MFKHVMGEDSIEGFSGESEFVDVAYLEGEIRDAICSRPALGARNFGL
jgi:hypothetical protein